MFWDIAFVLLGLQFVMGFGLTIWSRPFRGDGKALLGLLAAEIGIPLTVFGLASLGYWLHPPQPTPDALGPSPWWPALMSCYLSLLPLAIACIIIVKVVIQASLRGVRRIENRRSQHPAAPYSEPAARSPQG